MGERKRKSVALASGTVRGCGNCVHFKHVQDVLGLCRARPPVPVMVGLAQGLGPHPQPVVQAHWPQVADSELCGEWERRIDISSLDAAALAAEPVEGTA